MNARAYDIFNTLGIVLASVGAGLNWGIGSGLMVAGGLVIGMTVFTASRAGLR